MMKARCLAIQVVICYACLACLQQRCLQRSSHSCLQLEEEAAERGELLRNIPPAFVQLPLVGAVLQKK